MQRRVGRRLGVDGRAGLSPPGKGHAANRSGSRHRKRRRPLLRAARASLRHQPARDVRRSGCTSWGLLTSPSGGRAGTGLPGTSKRRARGLRQRCGEPGDTTPRLLRARSRAPVGSARTCLDGRCPARRSGSTRPPRPVGEAARCGLSGTRRAAPCCASGLHDSPTSNFRDACIDEFPEPAWENPEMAIGDLETSRHLSRTPATVPLRQRTRGRAVAPADPQPGGR